MAGENPAFFRDSPRIVTTLSSRIVPPDLKQLQKRPVLVLWTGAPSPAPLKPGVSDWSMMQAKMRERDNPIMTPPKKNVKVMDLGMKTHN